MFDTASIVTEHPPSASVTYPNFDMLVISGGYESLPDGTQYAIEVGNLALGAPNLNQSWNEGSGQLNSSLVKIFGRHKLIGSSYPLTRNKKKAKP
jgi:hypothetical protein